MLETLAQTVNSDERLVDRGKYVTAAMLMDLGEDKYVVTIQNGRVMSVEPPFAMPTWTFAVRAPLAEWQEFWQPKPKPGSHDIFALLRRRVAAVEGDLHPFMANLMYFKGVLSAPRQEAGK